MTSISNKALKLELQKVLDRLEKRTNELNKLQVESNRLREALEKIATAKESRGDAYFDSSRLQKCMDLAKATLEGEVNFLDPQTTQISTQCPICLHRKHDGRCQGDQICCCYVIQGQR